jgi:hypothetical protein
MDSGGDTQRRSSFGLAELAVFAARKANAESHERGGDGDDDDAISPAKQRVADVMQSAWAYRKARMDGSPRASFDARETSRRERERGGD